MLDKWINKCTSMAAKSISSVQEKSRCVVLFLTESQKEKVCEREKEVEIKC